jgi:hypothetical protein
MGSQGDRDPEQGSDVTHCVIFTTENSAGAFRAEENSSPESALADSSHHLANLSFNLISAMC